MAPLCLFLELAEKGRDLDEIQVVMGARRGPSELSSTTRPLELLRFSCWDGFVIARKNLLRLGGS